MPKKDLFVSRSPTGLNFYLGEELATVLGGVGAPLGVSRKGMRSFIIFYDENSPTHLLKSASGLPFRVIFGNGRLRHFGVADADDLFGATQATWAHDAAQHRSVTVTLPNELMEPKRFTKRSPSPKMAMDPFVELRNKVADINELMEMFREQGVTFFAEVGDGHGNNDERIIIGKISGQRIIKEEF